MTEQEIKRLQTQLDKTISEVHKQVIGQEKVIKEILIAFLAGGHALLEGVPGLAKTLMIKSLSQALALDFKRIQFTPDMMPADIIGTEVLDEDKVSGQKTFKFVKGPVFTNMLLADEINRTPPKTQSALLQAMQEAEVSYAGHNYALEQPFLLLATQNPIEQSGTYPLPEAQLDRFLLLINVSYPNEATEFEILKQTTGNQSKTIQQTLSKEDIMLLRQYVRDIVISDDLIARINRLVRMSRPIKSSIQLVKDYVRWGAGPRAGQAVILCAKAHSLISGRLAVMPEDIRAVAPAVLRHRILLNYQAEAEGKSVDDISRELINKAI